MSEIETFTVGEIQVAAEQEQYKQWHSALSDQIPGLRYQEEQGTIVSMTINGPAVVEPLQHDVDEQQDEIEDEDKEEVGNQEGEIVQNGNQTPPEPEEEDDFIIHKVGKMDTLIGLAVRYNVTVQDLKRVNYIVSELELYTRDNLLVPTKPMSLDQEMMTKAAKIVSGFDKPVHEGQEVKRQPGTSALKKQASLAKEGWEQIHPQSRSFDFPGDFLVDETIVPVNWSKRAGDFELTTLSSVVSKIKRVSMEASRAASHYFSERSRPSMDQSQNARQDASEFRRSVSTPQSGVHYGLGYTRPGVFSHTRRVGRSIGQGVMNLSRKIRSAVRPNGPQIARYADLADDVITGKADFSDPQSDLQELSNVEKQGQAHLTRLSKRSWGLRQG
eukprot:TRINITY_DN1298_c0_g1_i1.p1 TRINITY_DN1298_c0_g1~~TRINITY_DN1298_c0_g1_i1.p1  ORF type:complete len:387 (-),score=59.26 TRINITY_DN1298_c0_g1_i1:3106-4266(-)